MNLADFPFDTQILSMTLSTSFHHHPDSIGLGLGTTFVGSDHELFVTVTPMPAPEDTPGRDKCSQSVNRFNLAGF